MRESAASGTSKSLGLLRPQPEQATSAQGQRRHVSGEGGAGGRRQEVGLYQARRPNPFPAAHTKPITTRCSKHWVWPRSASSRNLAGFHDPSLGWHTAVTQGASHHARANAEGRDSSFTGQKNSERVAVLFAHSFRLQMSIQAWRYRCTRRTTRSHTSHTRSHNSRRFESN